MRVLVAEQQAVMRRLVVSCLEGSYVVDQATTLEEVVAILRQHSISLLVLDAALLEGRLETLQQLRKEYPSLALVVMSYQDVVNEIGEVIEQGVTDYLLKPFSIEMLEATLERVIGRVGQPSGEAAVADGLQEYIRLESLPSTRSHPAMKRAVLFLENVAECDVTVLISGESGVGKEIFARSLHWRSKRKTRRFIPLNCAAVPSELLESELFGAERGAYTGSVRQRFGKFELAHQGTLLLDEVSEMDMALQAKLLRVIQEKEVYRVGGDERVQLDVRLVATTNRSLREWVRLGRFREDLFYRLNVITLEVPPLRERVEDIPVLAHHIINRFNRKHPNKKLYLSMEAIDQLCRYPWPGNVRELENVIIRTALVTPGPEITDIHFDEFEAVEEDEAPSMLVTQKPESTASSAFQTLEEMERQMIRKALEAHTGNRTHAANALGISVRTLRNKLRRFPDLDPCVE